MNSSKDNTSSITADQNRTMENLSKKYGEVLTILLREGYLTRIQIEYAFRVKSKLKTPRPVLDIVKELKYITDDQIRKVIQENLESIRIGDLLVELGLISDSDLQAGLDIHAGEKPKRKLTEILIAHRFIDERKMLEALSLRLGFPFIKPELVDIDRELFDKAPVKLYETCGFIPIRRADNEVIVAFVDPIDQSDIEKATNIFQCNIRPAIASKKSINAAIQRLTTGVGTMSVTAGDGESATQIVDSIIAAAIEEEHVSDIHIEPMRDRLRVRFRMDGVLVHHRDLLSTYIPGITSRIKIMCEADIAERRRHQGGRFILEKNGEHIDFRVSFYVTIHGEKIVVRLLNRKSQLLDIEDIGMSPRMLERFRQEALDCPSGVLTITGPTGSGKTTTVYSCINYLNSPQTSIITAEEPVEYVIEGVSQCSINPKIDLTFEETLRHIVRQDPDVIVIGEIRDSYSAEVAVQAALTGHKVLTTFHTEDSIGGLIRLLNMDIDAFMISSTVVCVLAQRLLRKVCPACQVPYELSPGELLRLGYTSKEIQGAKFRKGKGCSQCRQIGYKGRIAVFELLLLNEPVRDGLIDRKTSHQIRHISTESTGLVTLLEDGIAKAARGITTVEEILRCLPRLQKPRPLAELRRLLGN